MSYRQSHCDVGGCERPHYSRGYCSLHYRRAKVNGDPLAVKHIRGNDEARFWSYVDRQDTDSCWLWNGCVDGDGYGIVGIGNRGNVRAHRFSYELSAGPIPADLVIDHLCRVRNCVNPAHLEPVTSGENVRRGLRGVLKTHCPQGHPYDDANTYMAPDGSRVCRECARTRTREWKRARRAVAS